MIYNLNRFTGKLSVLKIR